MMIRFLLRVLGFKRSYHRCAWEHPFFGTITEYDLHIRWSL